MLTGEIGIWIAGDRVEMGLNQRKEHEQKVVQYDSTCHIKFRRQFNDQDEAEDKVKKIADLLAEIFTEFLVNANKVVGPYIINEAVKHKGKVTSLRT